MAEKYHIAYVPLHTLGELKKALKGQRHLWVWCNWERADGSYVKVSKREFLKNIGADTPNDGAHGGRADHTPVHAKIEDDEVHVG